jgi:hypothetical protein
MPSFLFESVNAIKPGLNYRAMATNQQNDQDIQNYCTAISNLRLEDVPSLRRVYRSSKTYSAGNLAQESILSDMTLKRPLYRPCITVLSMCSTVIQNISLYDFGIEETRFPSTV